MGTQIQELNNAIGYESAGANVAAPASIGSRPWRFAVAIAFGLVLVNVPYWLVEHLFGLEQLGWLALEYSLASVLAMYVPSLISTVVLLGLMFVDLLYGICVTYYLTIGPCLSNLSAIESFSTVRIAGVCLMTALLAATAFATAWLQRNWVQKQDRRFAAVLILAFVVIVQGADFVEHGTTTGILPNFLHVHPLMKDGAQGESTVLYARNPVMRLARLEWAFDIKLRLAARNQIAHMRSVPSASSLALHDSGVGAPAGITQNPNVVLILVESWGISTSGQLNALFRSTYSDAGIEQKYRVQSGTVPFFGSTVAGESRELCSNSAAFGLLHASAEELNQCLPAQMNRLGYHTIALHGMDGDMFDRDSWYKTMGFQEMYFRDEFRGIGTKFCSGAFTGACDSDLADWIGNRLEQSGSQPLFLYWVTLSSHLPVPIPSGLKDPVPCPAAFQNGAETVPVAPTTLLCSWYQLEQNVHHSIAKLAMSNLARPTEFIIVGDHAPPFGRAERRRLFSQANVPYLILSPK